jgi:hypothetical protein
MTWLADEGVSGAVPPEPRAASDTVGRRCCSDPGDDLDPGVVHRLEPLSLLLGILVWNGADELVVSAVLVGPDRHCARLSDLAGGNVATAWQGPQNGTSHPLASETEVTARQYVKLQVWTKRRFSRSRRPPWSSGNLD